MRAVIHRRVLPLVGADNADDVTQEVLLELWRIADRFDVERATVEHWAGMIARRRAIDHLRSRSAARRRQETFDLRENSRDGDAGDAALLDRDEMAIALRRLPLAQRRALFLVYYLDLTGIELAAHEGIPIGTAKSRIRDGLIRMRRAHDTWTS